MESATNDGIPTSAGRGSPHNHQRTPHHRLGQLNRARAEPVLAPRAAAHGNVERIEMLHPNGQHNLAVGVDWPVEIDIRGHAGYFIAGMNKQARVTVHGNVGWSVAENIMSGMVRVRGNASECAAASGHGGLVVIEGNASSRCGISMKGCDIVVGGSVGHVSAFMAQAGRLVVCGDAGAGTGRFALRSRDLRPRQDARPRRRCSRRSDDRRRPAARWPSCWPRPASTTTPPNSNASPPPARYIIGTPTPRRTRIRNEG